MCLLLPWLHRRLLIYSHHLDSLLNLAYHSGLHVQVHAAAPAFLESNEESQCSWEKCKENFFSTSKQDQDPSPLPCQWIHPYHQVMLLLYGAPKLFCISITW
jgi:hypothetical protein